jgi:hypothetical protein
VKPKYGPLCVVGRIGKGGYNGGTEMEVCLGPKAAESRNGTIPRGDSCKAVNDLNAPFTARHQDPPWVKGHLLNQELGGPGNSENLTPLTQKANGKHKTAVELKIKAALAWCRQRAGDKETDPTAKALGTDKYFYGVYYKVTIKDDKGGFPRAYEKATDNAHKAVAAKMTCALYYVRRSKTGGEPPAKVDRPQTTDGRGKKVGAPELPSEVTIRCSEGIPAPAKRVRRGRR